MPAHFSVVIPAYAAARTLPRAITSLVAQTAPDWEAIVVADDDTDYEAVLDQAGIQDRRARHTSTGASEAGSPVARNLGLELARNDLIVILDADDLMDPAKLESARAVLPEYGLVSSALTITDAALRPLRTIGAGPDRQLRAGTYKFVNISMDSMLIYDRRRADPRFDTSMPRLTDIDFLLKLFCHIPVCYHFGTPLHTYVKEPDSVSNRPGASENVIATKHLMIERLETGYYALPDPDDTEGMLDFWRLSLGAEEAFGPLIAENPDLLFEDHLEPFLSAASTSPA
jgi:glycosyltransferase involved in cell wall biosynthesis